jgi:hypothetical protein
MIWGSQWALEGPEYVFYWREGTTEDDFVLFSCCFCSEREKRVSLVLSRKAWSQWGAQLNLGEEEQ